MIKIKNNLKYFILLIIISTFSFFTINYFVQLRVESIKKDRLTSLSNNIKMLLDQAIEDKIYSTLNIGISISEYAASNNILSKGNEDRLKDLKNISIKIEKNSNFKNLWIHVVDAKGVSRYRNWTSKTNDYLLDARKELIPLLKNPKITSVISVGIFDLTFKSIVPIFKGKQFMGLIETITKFNSIAELFKRKDIDLLILVDKKYKGQIKKPFSKHFVDDYYVANTNAKEDLLKITKQNLNRYLNIDKCLIDSNKFITRYEIKDFDNKEMANILTFQDYNQIYKDYIKNLEDSLKIIANLIVLIIIFIFTIVYYFNRSKYTKKLEKEVKKRTIELNQSIKRYKQLFEGSKAIKIVIDPKSQKIYDANRAALDFYGYTKEEITKLKTSDINITIKDENEIYENVINKRKNIYHFKHKLANGKIRDVEVYSSLINIDDKQLIYSIIRDITEELKIRKELQKKQKLFYQQAKMASMGEMLENIAHQWRQPLSTITTAASGIKLKKEFGLLDDAFLDHSIGIITKSANFLSQTIEDFRSFFKHSDKEEDFKIFTAIQEALNIINMKIDSNKIKIEIKDRDKIKINGYKNEFIQMFLNLFNNSIETLNNSQETNRIIFINIEKKEHTIEISFQDNAKGIDEKIMDKVFEPYFTTKHKSQGKGIGLYMCKQIIEKHFNGQIRVQNNTFEFNSKSYFGANFIITLPLE